MNVCEPVLEFFNIPFFLQDGRARKGNALHGHGEGRINDRAGDHLRPLGGSQNGVLRFCAGDRRVPGEGLIFLDDVRRFEIDPIIPGDIPDRASLVVKLPFLRIPFFSVGTNPLLQDFPGWNPWTRVGHESTVYKYIGFIFFSQ